MGRVIVVDIPESNDDKWLVDRINDLNSRLEELVFDEEDKERYDNLGACLDIVNAIQEYMGV